MSKAKQYCNILQYLEKKDKSLHAAINDLCAGGMFVPRNAGSGRTFLYPESAKLRKEIVDGMQGSGEAPMKAYQMLQTLVLSMGMQHADDFNTYKDDIPNQLRQKLEVDKVVSGKVFLKNGNTLEKDPKFTPRSDRKNIAVYIMKGDKPLPLDGKKSDGKYLGKGKSGGYSGSSGVTAEKLYKDAVENFKSGSSSCDLVTESVLSYMNWCSNKREKEYFAKDGCFSKLSRHPHIDFFTALCLHPNYSGCRGGTVNEWLSETGGVYYAKGDKSLYQTYNDLYDAHAAKYAEKNPEVKFEELDWRTSSIAKPSVVNAIKTKYGIDLVNKYGSELINKLWRDEMRLLCWAMLKDTDAKRSDYVDALERIYTPVNNDNHLVFIGDTCWQNKDQAYYLSSTFLFARSTACAHVPMGSKKLHELEGDKEGKVIKDGSSINKDFFNLDLALRDMVAAMPQVSAKHNIASVLSSMSKEEIQKYLAERPA